MTIGRICQRDVDLVDPEESAQVAAQRMASRNVGALLVLDADKQPIGILTDRDLALRVLGRGRDGTLTRVSDVMTPDPHVVLESTPIEDALASMRSHGLRRMPVVDARGRLAGVVALDDVLDLLAEELGTIRRLLERSSPRALR